MPGDISWQTETPLGGLRAPLCLAQALIPLGYDVAIAANCSTRREEIQGVPLISVSDPTLSTWKKTLESVGKIDALIALSRLDLFQFGLGNRQICWNHNPCVLLGVPEFGRPLYFVSQKVVCPSRSSANQQRAWGVPAKKIDVIPNGLDHSIFNSHQMSDEDERLLRFVFIGTCSPWKGLDIALEAFLKIHTIYPSATLQIFGDSPGWPVQRYAPSKNLPLNQKNEIDWVAIQAQYPCVSYYGLCHPHQIASELRRAGFLLCPSRHEETFALAPLEAQACGCIPIAPSHGAYPERIENGVSGFTYLPNSPDMLEAIIVRALENINSLGKIRKACISNAQNFTWEETARSFVRLIDSIPHLRKSSIQRFNAASALKYALRRVRLKQ
jgi:glycosyltransferase involved in cell wall biosynthesis